MTFGRACHPEACNQCGGSRRHPVSDCLVLPSAMNNVSRQTWARGSMSNIMSGCRGMVTSPFHARSQGRRWPREAARARHCDATRTQWVATDGTVNLRCQLLIAKTLGTQSIIALVPQPRHLVPTAGAFLPCLIALAASTLNASVRPDMLFRKSPNCVYSASAGKTSNSCGRNNCNLHVSLPSNLPCEPTRNT